MIPASRPPAAPPVPGLSPTPHTSMDPSGASARYPCRSWATEVAGEEDSLHRVRRLDGPGRAGHPRVAASRQTLVVDARRMSPALRSPPAPEKDRLSP